MKFQPIAFIKFVFLFTFCILLSLYCFASWQYGFGVLVYTEAAMTQLLACQANIPHNGQSVCTDCEPNKWGQTTCHACEHPLSRSTPEALAMVIHRQALYWLGRQVQLEGWIELDLNYWLEHWLHLPLLHTKSFYWLCMLQQLVAIWCCTLCMTWWGACWTHPPIKEEPISQVYTYTPLPESIYDKPVEPAPPMAYNSPYNEAQWDQAMRQRLVRHTN